MKTIQIKFILPVILSAVFMVSAVSADTIWALHLGDETPDTVLVSDVVSGKVYLENLSPSDDLTIGSGGDMGFPGISLEYEYVIPEQSDMYTLTLFFSTPEDPFTLGSQLEYAFWSFTLAPTSGTVPTGMYTVYLDDIRNNEIDKLSFEVTAGNPVPEPASVFLLGAGLLLIFIYRKIGNNSSVRIRLEGYETVPMPQMNF
ncbi:MAG: PEP-CTERM sorting domain-containing protein [Proteobacteria bacterium]|nr:PEP-CTERM sorting domain-containing protein [Pseudomonadota bacterium]